MKPKTGFWIAGFVLVVGMWRVVYAAENKTTKVVNVGVVLDLNSWIGKMGLSCINMSLSDFYFSHPHHNTTIVLHIADSKDDAVLAATQASELIQKSEVDAILGPESLFQSRYIIQLSEKAEVPIVSFAPTTTSTLTSHLKSPYLFRVPYNHSSQIYAIRDLIKAFGWKHVVTIYQDDDFGKWIVTYLIEALQEEKIYTRIHRIDPAASGDQIREELLSTKQATIFVVHMVHGLASQVVAMAYKIGKFSQGYAWILTDATTNALNSMNFSTLNSMQGALGVKTYVPRTMELENFTKRWRRKFRQDNPDVDDPQLNVYGLWAYDAAWALAMAVETIESDSNFTAAVSENGKKIMESQSMKKFKGLSGEFSLVKGQLESQNFEIVNLIGDGESTVGYWTPAFGMTGEFNRTGNLRPIIWPGYSIIAPKGRTALTVGNTLRIGVPLSKDFMSFDMKTGDISGYCADIFDAAVSELPYVLPYVFIPFQGSNYDRLILEVYRGTYDAAVGDITILANRSSFVDFTLPFTEPGISVVVPVRHDLVNHAWVFLKPLNWKLWFTTFCFFVFMGFIVWILEHQNNEDFRCGSLSHQIGTSLWFSFSIMVFAQKETLRSNLTRFVVVIWFFVVFVLTQSYTASLTSWLTVQQLRPVTDVNLIIKNNWHVGYREDSYAGDTLKFLGIKNLVPFGSLVELHELFTKGSRNGGVDVAIDEKPYMKLFLAKYSDKYTMGDSQYNSGGFGFAFSIGSPLLDDMSKAVLRVTQSDKRKQIDEKWFGNKISSQSGSSDSSEASSSSLDLSYFSSLFIITAAAAIFALTLYFWRRIIATFHVFTMKDGIREGQVVVEPPAAAAVELEVDIVEASASTDATPSPSNNDSVHSSEGFNGFADSSHQNQASLEITHC